MATPPMLRPRNDEPVRPAIARDADPLGSLTVMFLGAIALALLVAAILAVYTYSTPAVELPLVVAISLAFAFVLAFNLLGRAVHHWRTRP